MHASAFSLATSIPTILPCCAILPLPSLLVRALTPMQLCGLKEAPDLSLALPQGLPLVVTGSGPATGGCCSRPPVRIHSQISSTQGWPTRSGGRLRVSPPQAPHPARPSARVPPSPAVRERVGQ